MGHVLIVDDEPSICWGFRELLTDEGHDVSIAASAEDALELVSHRAPDAVVLDVRLPGLDGISAIEHLRDRIGDAPIIVMTAFGNLETAVDAIEAGAFDYLAKPFDLEQVVTVLERALQKVGTATRPASQLEAQSPDTLIGSSPAMQAVFKQIALVAAQDVPVLVTGESGTGKELVSRAIHRHSLRRSGPFLPINLAALSSSVIESELFGHIKGAFTGADRDRAGILELADGGTVLLDEIGDISPELQVKLLRALELREVSPVGDPRPRKSDFRIVAATNRSLPELVAAREFREDLFYRLSVFQIELPPLRERPTDIPLLANYFLGTFAGQRGRMQFSEAAMQELISRPWYGNVRELRNTVERAAIVARGECIDIEHIPEPLLPPPNLAKSQESTAGRLQQLTTRWLIERLQSEDDAIDLYDEFIAVVESPLIEATLEHVNCNRAKAARILGIHRATLREKMRRHEL